MLPGDPNVKSARIAGLEALLSRDPRDMTAEQLAKVAAAMMGLYASARRIEDMVLMESYASAHTVVVAELVRRARDLDPDPARDGEREEAT